MRSVRAYIRQILMIVFAILVILALQYQYWFGENGYYALQVLQKQVSEQQYINSEQQKANKVLLADVNDLKNGLEAVEEHARADLGLIKPGETFVQLSIAPNAYDQHSQPQSSEQDNANKPNTGNVNE